MATSEQLALANEKVKEAKSKQSDVESLQTWITALQVGTGNLDSIKLTRTVIDSENPENPDIVSFIVLKEPEFDGLNSDYNSTLISTLQDQILDLEDEIATLLADAEALMNS